MKNKFLLYSMIVILLFLSVGIYLITQNENNKISKIIKDNTPSNVKYFLKKTIFYIPLKVREFKEIKEINKGLNEKNSKLIIENNVLSNHNLKKFGEDPLLLTNPIEIVKFMKDMPLNVRILLDFAHLKVSSNSLGFDLLDATSEIQPWIQGYHLSDNDGSSDSNNVITSDSWFWKVLDKNKTYFTIEVYGVNTNELLNQYNFVFEKFKHV